jgi:RNA polymerase sigma-70 factor (ECF subfamily)
MLKAESNQSLTELHRLEGQRDFIRLWTAASRRVHAYILTLVLNWADAEDLLQEVGVTAWEKFRDFEPGGDFVAWACGIARNKVLNFNQQAGRRLVISSDLMEQIEDMVRSESSRLERQHDALQQCLDRLPEADRQLLRLRYMPGVPIKLLAEETGRSVDAIYKSLQRIYARLSECISRRLQLQEER